MERLPQTFKMTRGVIASPCPGRDYSGIRYSFTFNPSKDITIHALHFFGPHYEVKDLTSVYAVAIEIRESFVGRRGFLPKLLEETNFQKSVQREKKIMIELPNPIPVKMGQNVDILFELNGPKTGFLGDLKMEYIEPKSGVKFDCLRGSAQLSDIVFALSE